MHEQILGQLSTQLSIITMCISLVTTQKLGCFEIYAAVVALVLFGTHISEQVLVELLGTVTVEAAVEAVQNQTP